MNLPRLSPYIIDHKNLNKRDNRRCNLRICTDAENVLNKGLQHRNKSGCPGVRWYAPRNKWQARIRKDKKEYHLGYFVNKDDAIEARKEAEKKYFGDFACDQY